MEESSKERDGLSPFVFLQPKMELDSSPPRASQVQAKPKFEPKVKARPQARAKVKSSISKAANEQPLSAQPKVDVFQSHLSASCPPPSPEAVKDEPRLANKMDLDVKPQLETAEVAKWSSNHAPYLKSEEDFETKPEPDLEVKKEPVAPDISFVDDIEDKVVREIDVFLCPVLDSDTQLYLLQYPLRPHWRPYELEKWCQEVRVKPKQSKLEVDLAIVTDGENYNDDAADHLKIKKQTLISSRTALTTNYVGGILRGNKLHLNPIHAVVQLRPSLRYLDEADVRNKKHTNQNLDNRDEEMVDADNEHGEEEATEDKQQLVALKVEVKKQETERQEQLRLQSHAYLKQLDEAEPWISLEPHGMDSPVTDEIRCRMVTTSDRMIPFHMSRFDYIKCLVPGRATPNAFAAISEDANEVEGLSRSFLDTLPLEQRFEKLLSKGRVQILQFDRLMKLAPAGCTEQEILSVLQDYAYLVQGCWVAASSLRYSGPICILRDYILSLFTKKRVIDHQHLEELQVPREMIREVLVHLAVQKPAEAGWEFQETTDRSFMKRHQVIVKEQAQKWLENEDKIKAAALVLKVGSTKSNAKTVSHQPKGSQLIQKPVANPSIGAKAPNDVQGSAWRGSETGAFSGEWTMSEETRVALPGALREIFMKYHVCSLQFICQSLREMAITKASSPNANPKSVAAAVAAAKGANAHLPELSAVVSQVASNIDGIYFLTSLGNASLDSFRDVVIALLRAKGANTGLRKLDIMEAAKIALKTEVQTHVYQKVLKELCYTRGGAWVLKPGDGRPS